MPDTDIQKLLDSPGRGGTVNIPPGEYEGRFVINKSCKVNGNGAVFWAASGPALVVGAKKVSVSDLRIGLTADNIPYEQRTAVYCKYPDTKFTDTEINGMLLGIPGEEQFWGLPRIVSLGRLPAGREQSFLLELYTPADAELHCGFHDLRLSANTLAKGFNTVTMTVGKMRGGSLLYGYIFVKSAVTRKIIVSGEIGGEDEPAPVQYMLCTVDREAPMRHSDLIERLDPEQLTAMPAAAGETVEIPLSPIDEADGGDYEENVTVPAGKRLPVSMKKYRIELRYRGARCEPDIDGYLFMLGSGGVVSSDRRMIFFGCEQSDCGSVRYINEPQSRAMLIDFANLPEDVTRMTLLFSFYGDDPSRVFSCLDGGEISVLCENGVHMHVPLEMGINCRTILALGFEKNDGVWEMITSGKGVGMPLADICRSYGVIVCS